MTTTTNTNNDVRSILLAALDLGAWQAEHLTGADLARQVVELLAWYRRELRATMVRLQRLAIDVQELQSGEAWDQLLEERAGAEMDAAAWWRKYVELAQAVWQAPGEEPVSTDDIERERHEDTVELALAQGAELYRLKTATGESFSGLSPMVLDGED